MHHVQAKVASTMCELIWWTQALLRTLAQETNYKFKLTAKGSELKRFRL